MTEIAVVDAFTDRPFSGNPAGVCILASPAEPGWMQRVALEMNLSETAFVVRSGDEWEIRWFTPTTEVDLCGHATLASAAILWQDGCTPPDQSIRFRSASGLLTAVHEGGWIRLDFPSVPAQPRDIPSVLRQSLGVSCHAVCQSQFDYLVELESEELLRQLRPQLNQIRLLPVRGVIVTARSSNPTFDFVSRFFAPASGISEDPVTGSAHCTLGPYWSDRLGKTELVGYQASSRGGVVRVQVHGERVHLFGQTVTTMRSRLLV